MKTTFTLTLPPTVIDETLIAFYWLVVRHAEHNGGDWHAALLDAMRMRQIEPEFLHDPNNQTSIPEES